MASPKSSKSSPMWVWWYKNCLVQQIYLVLSVIAGILLGGYVILLATMKIHQTGYGPNDKIVKLFDKFRARIITYFILSFALSFFINNLILVQYCNQKLKGATNIIVSLVMFFIVVPMVSSIISFILGRIILADLIEEAKAAQMEGSMGDYGMMMM